MRLRGLVAMAATFVLSQFASAAWPVYDADQNGVIGFPDLSAAITAGDFSRLISVLSDYGGPVVFDVNGNPSAPGADARAIARWNAVPYQTITGQFKVGVVAFHINGIEKVSFSANDGPWLDITDMTLNERTNTHEYWITVDPRDFADGPINIRAIAFPKNGFPRVLAGEITASNAWGGNYGMVLYANTHGTMPQPTVYVAGYGSDSAGNGTVLNPYRTFSKAIASRIRPNGDSAGLTVNCLPGDYAFGQAGNSLATNSFDGRWVTVQAAPGVSPDQVRITQTYTGGLVAQRLRLKDLTIEGQQRITGDALWFDGVKFNGAGLDIEYKVFTAAWSPQGIFVTNCTSRNSRNAVRGAHYIRNTVVETVSGSPFGSAPMTVNSRCDRYILTDFHGDVFHWTIRENDPADANVIVYNVSAPNFDSQGVFAETYGGSVFNNVALVNLLIHKGSDTASGSWWETSTNHLLMRGVTMDDQYFRFPQENFGTTIKNAQLNGVIVKAFSHTPLPTSTRYKGIHITAPETYGSWTPSTPGSTTFGNPMFVNPAQGDFRPAAGSPLIGRLTLEPAGLRVDAMNRQRANSTAAGAMRSVTE